MSEPFDTMWLMSWVDEMTETYGPTVVYRGVEMDWATALTEYCGTDDSDALVREAKRLEEGPKVWPRPFQLASKSVLRRIDAMKKRDEE